MTWQLAMILGTVAAWTLAGAAVLTHVAVREWRRRRAAARRSIEGDPIDTLTLQIRLGEIAHEIQALAASNAFAAAHHTRAAQAAYDALLAEACRRAGLPVEGPGEATARTSEAERLREELELASRGWTW
ncbi:hypothetical protein [Xylanimonas ulmi]|uniref:Uncharacterized protein n=1 Tax=Xylanimonas ulmi TaxID=228973 RepID=A0A4Q7M6R4_9MICO|nr:hypothetical protein [Xylanibacterium ulmi]RZS62332.1 hypothetical protein EV386_2664 [Xylanibacterium ulmi]